VDLDDRVRTVVLAVEQRLQLDGLDPILKRLDRGPQLVADVLALPGQFEKGLRIF
jgi:hypothetical protein